jgi:curli production assembly/transport component CsgE
MTEREREIEERNEQERMAEAVDKNRTQSQSDRSDQQEAKREDLQRESERQIMIEIDGMVHDDTRSKVGRDFYNVFYTYWQQPANARNFTIRISEQPSPNLGTTIYVTVNYTETFRMRLQPRYEMIEEAGKYAVRQTYAYLQNNYKETIIY